MFQIFNGAGYIFTNRKNPKWGIMSSVLGIISVISICIVIYLAYQNKGTVYMQHGAVVALAAVYSLIGLALGIKTIMEEDIYRIFPVIGIILNTLSVMAECFIFYMGVAH